jgi:poly-beta-1,6-N-acetyl-D-glucosamine synthase
MNNRLLIITPCRDEAQFCRASLESVIRQTLRPAMWIIVDDGSTDETPKILAEYEEACAFIKVLRRENRGKRAVGSGVVEAFYAGLELVNLDYFDFLCKLDLDLELPRNYFEILIGRMRQDPWLGTCSGKSYFVHPKTKQLTSERIGDEMSVGATKLYRVDCFKEIGGFVAEVSWDGIDCHQCRRMGWVAQSWDERDLRFLHHRQMGSSDRSLLKGRLRWGRGKWYMGSSLLYVVAVSLYRMKERPYLIGGLGILLGYLKSILSGAPRYKDRELRRFLRRYEMRSMFLGKRRTMELYHEKIRAAVNRAAS